MEILNFILKIDNFSDKINSKLKLIQWVVIYIGIAFILLFGHLTNANFVYEQF